MQRTEHYNLSKPERTDPFRAQDVADNLDAIDEAIHNAAKSGSASVDGMDIKPASVTATGDVADNKGTLDAVRQAAQPSTIVNLVYPVGSIYMSVNSASPATLFGGTWERITGRFLLGATDNGGTGGNSTASVRAGCTGGEASHKLTSAESGIPAHHHSMTHGHKSNGYVMYDNAYSGGSYLNLSQGGRTGWTSQTPPDIPNYTGNTGDNSAANASNAHNNMPPYLAVYIWKRTA